MICGGWLLTLPPWSRYARVNPTTKLSMAPLSALRRPLVKTPIPQAASSLGFGVKNLEDDCQSTDPPMNVTNLLFAAQIPTTLCAWLLDSVSKLDAGGRENTSVGLGHIRIDLQTEGVSDLITGPV